MIVIVLKLQPDFLTRFPDHCGGTRNKRPAVTSPPHIKAKRVEVKVQRIEFKRSVDMTCVAGEPTFRCSATLVYIVVSVREDACRGVDIRVPSSNK